MSFSVELANRTHRLLRDFEASDVYQQFFHSRSDAPFVRAVVRRLLFEVGTYGPWITSATFTAVGRLSHLRPKVESLTAHLLEEVSHPRFAMEGFLTLGGDEGEAARGKLSPAAFAVASVCGRIAEEAHPAAYLGYVYLLESTTAILGVRVRNLLESGGLEDPFITMHSTEDVIHTEHVATEVDAVVTDVPDASAAIADGFDWFAAVYPLPIWTTALEAAMRELDPN